MRSGQWRLMPHVLSTVFFTFACYFAVGLPMAVIPHFIDTTLGFGPVVAGAAIGAQYVGTIASRSRAGRLADAAGAKSTVAWGLIACGVSGLLLLLAGRAAAHPALGLTLLLVGRLCLGFGESCVGTGAIAWGIGGLGEENAVLVISWNGVATYGALAVAAPLGVLVDARYGLTGVGLLTIAIGGVSVWLSRFKPSAAIVAGARAQTSAVFRQVLPYGAALALGSIGFGALMTFVTLFYAGRGWTGAAYCLSAFGLAFVGARLAFTGLIARVGGARAAMVSLGVECIGLLVLGRAMSPAVALVGAGLTGLGLSLVFPALAVEVIALFPASNRGAVVGAYTVFLDVALAVVGPLAGLSVRGDDYAPVFLWTAAAAGSAVVLTATLRRRRA